MLVRFTVSNYLSFADTVTFDMRPGNIQKDGDLGRHVYEDSVGKTVYTLPLGVVFGANASGKSNFIAAIAFMRSCVLGSIQRQHDVAGDATLPVVPFLLDSKLKNEPSLFEVHFKWDGVLYNYGFVISEKQFHEEWLYAYFTRKETCLFHRFVDEKQNQFQQGTERAKLQKMGEFLPPSTLVLSLFHTSQTLKPVYDWFAKLTIIFPSSEFSDLSQKVFLDPNFSQFLSQYLHEIDTGIEEIEALKQEDAEKSLMQLPAAARLRPRGTTQRSFFIREPSYQLFSRHTGEEKIAFPVGLESEGTLRMMHLLPVFYLMTNNKNSVFFIDELDNSLHTMLSKWFVDKFLSINQQHPSQLIFTTHDTNLLSSSSFRRDEIWFVEKSKEGASSFSRLSEFKVSDGLNYENGYISGRFGGIPKLYK